MKVLRRYTVRSVLKVGIITALLAALMLVGVDLFKNLDTFISYQVEIKTVLKLSALYFPEAFLLGLGPSFLFSITYFLSQFHASNEYISVLNSGIKYNKVIKPCIIAGIFVALSFFVINECIALPFSNRKEVLFNDLTYKSSSKNNNSNISLSDNENGYLVYAEEYLDSVKTIYNVTLIKKDQSGRLLSRTNAYKAIWNDENGYWTFHDAYTYIPSAEVDDTRIEYNKTLVETGFNLQPEMFKNLSDQISKMPLKLAFEYLNRIKKLNPEQYASMGTELYKRILSCLTPLIMIIIACCLNYQFKKNVMFFSLICSICVAVVYYVIQMLTIMLADQGVILPVMGMIIPFASIIVLAVILSLILRK